ncbi:MAG: hypothetical protein QW303_04180 [Nitrososphaerota archaeon]
MDQSSFTTTKNDLEAQLKALQSKQDQIDTVADRVTAMSKMLRQLMSYIQNVNFIIALKEVATLIGAITTKHFQNTMNPDLSLLLVGGTV